MPPPPDIEIATLAARQHGVFGSRQASAAGLSSFAIRRRVASGAWVPVLLDTYRLAGTPTSWEQSILAACLSGGELVVASHRTAAALWGLDGFRPGIVECTAQRWLRRPRGGVRTHESLDLDPVDCTERRAVPVTTVARTILDLGAVVPVTKVEQALEDAVRRGLLTYSELEARLARVARRGRRGVGAVRQLLEERPTDGRRPTGEFERRLRRVIIAGGLPDPHLEYEVLDERGVFVARVDLAFPARLVCVEADGELWHTGRRRRQHDLARQNQLLLLGWTVLRFTWDDLVSRPDRVVSQVGRALTPV